jgi:hypothetical protein
LVAVRELVDFGRAIWVAVAKSRIKREEDVKWDQYMAVELDETNGTRNEDEFQMGESGWG